MNYSERLDSDTMEYLSRTRAECGISRHDALAEGEAGRSVEVCVITEARRMEMYRKLPERS